MTTNWTKILGTGLGKGKVGLEHAQQIYIHAFKWLLISTAIALAVGILLNNIGWKEGNFVLALMFLIASGFCFFYPGFLIWIFGLGSLNGLPKDWSLNRLLKEQALPDLQVSNLVEKGVNAIKKTVRWAAHITLFTQMLFVVLGTWELENSRVVIPILVVLTSIGLCTYLFSGDAKWYKRAAWSIMLISLAALVYNGYVYIHPQDKEVSAVLSALQRNEDAKKKTILSVLLEKASDGIPLTPEEEHFLKQMREETKSRSVTGFAESFFYSKTMELKVSTLDPQRLCGVRPGKRKFEIPETVYVLIEGTNFDLTSFIRVNDVLPQENFLVGDDGCVDISYALDGNTKFAPQFLRIKFS